MRSQQPAAAAAAAAYEAAITSTSPARQMGSPVMLLDTLGLEDVGEMDL